VEHNRVPGPSHTPLRVDFAAFRLSKKLDSIPFVISESSFKSLVGVSCDLPKKNVLLNLRDAEARAKPLSRATRIGTR